MNGRALGCALLYVLLGTLPGGHLFGQVPSRAFAVTFTHSLASATSAASTSCSPGGCGDVLSPVSMTTVELELAVPFRVGSAWGIDYQARAIPVAMVRQNPTAPAILGSQGWYMSVATERDRTFGLGLKPAGVRVWFGGSSVRLEVDASAGILHSGTPLFAANAARLNFLYDVGLGLRLPLGQNDLTLGYRRHHVSNAGFADVNPGLNSHVVFLGYRLD
jgi:hypothetical protein